MDKSGAPTRSRNSLVFGFSPQAELWNGRLAMIGFITIVLIEFFTHKGLLHIWGIL